MSYRYYPAFVNLEGRHCLVVGGGKVAERKTLSLLRAGAAVTVVSPALTSTLRTQKAQGKIGHIPRNYKKGDCKGAFLVIAATSDEKTNRRVSEHALSLVNVVDVPEMSSFIVPSIVQRGLLTFAVSTSGASPALAKTVRRELQTLYGQRFGKFLHFLQRIRKEAFSEIPDKGKRRQFLRGIASAKIVDTLRRDGFKAARREILLYEASFKERMRNDG